MQETIYPNKATDTQFARMLIHRSTMTLEETIDRLATAG